MRKMPARQLRGRVLVETMVRNFTSAAVLLLAFTFKSLAAEEAAAPMLAPEADAVLARTSEFFQKAKSASTQITVTITQAIVGKKTFVDTTKSTLAMERPNKFAFHLLESLDGKMAHVSDGKTVWTYIDPLKQFTTMDAPPLLDQLLMTQTPGLLPLMQAGFAMDLFRRDPHKAMVSGVQVLKVVGSEKLDGVECAHIHGEEPAMDWDAWFEKGDKPVLRRFIYSPLKGILAKVPEAEKAQLAGATFLLVVDFADWKVNEPLPAATFAYEPPKDAEPVEQFHDTPGERMEAPAEKLKGTVAPDFTGPLLAGGKLKLSDHIGKEIIILNFWATWCGPCVVEMPELAELAAAYKEKGVVLYTINAGEDDADVKDFLKSKKLDINVVMQPELEIAALYKVQGLPQTVIIGKDGKISFVIVGGGVGVKNILAHQLDALLAN